MSVRTGEVVFVKCVKDGIPNRDPLRDSDARRLFGPDDGRISLSDVSIKRDVRDYVVARFPDGGPGKDRFVFVQKKFNEDQTVLLGRGGLADDILKQVRTAKPAPSTPPPEPAPEAGARGRRRATKTDEGDIEKDLLAAAFDMRVFGAVFSVEKRAFNRVGPVQFGWAHSLHPVETRYVQGTVCMPSDDEKVTEKGEREGGKTQGTIWTQYQLPFAVFAMPGVVSGPIARSAGMKAADMDLLLEGLWKGTLARQVRGRGLQQPLLLLHVEYKDEFFRVGYLEEGLRLDPGRDSSDQGRDRTGREKWLGGAPPTAVSEVTLDVTRLAETLRANARHIERMRVWIDPKLRLAGELPADRAAWSAEAGGGRMSLVVAFEVRGELAHFRRPDTLGTHATYPFPTRTALRGLIAAVVGETAWPEGGRVGLRLLGPVRTVAQQLSMHGKTWEARSGQPQSFHRPTSVELVVQPHYRIYASGPLADSLAGMLRASRSRFHTYLGSAFCLTFPHWVGARDSAPVPPAERVECVSVVPAPAVGRLALEEGRPCARVGGVLLEHLGVFADRRFRGSTAVLYEPTGGHLVFEPTPFGEEAFWEFHELSGEGVVCLW